MAKPNLQNYSDVAESLQRVCILIFDALFALGVDGKRAARAVPVTSNLRIHV